MGQGLWFPWSDAIQPVAIVAGLVGASIYYRRRGVDNFVATLDALATLVAFSTVYTLAMYAIAATGRPWVDASLATFDHALGFSASEVVRWVDARPNTKFALEIAYFSVIPQTVLAIAWLGLRGSGEARESLRRFLYRFMLAAGLAALVFYFAPARERAPIMSSRRLNTIGGFSSISTRCAPARARSSLGEPPRG